MSAPFRTIRFTRMSPLISGSSSISASKRFTVTISGRDPQAALAKVTLSTATVGVSEIPTLRSPAIFRSRPVVCFTCAAIVERYSLKSME